MTLQRSPVSFANPLLSIVIAAYNVDGYIEEALESLLAQPCIDGIRIIVVDDGSTDDTYAAVQTVVERDDGLHIEVIRQKNLGVSAARNAGIAAVRTPYVGFLDGDDIYLLGFTSQIMPLLVQNRWDMVEFNVRIIDDDGHVLGELELVSPSENGDCSLDRAALQRFANTFHTFVCARIFRIELFNNVQFPLGRHYEDLAIVPSIHLLAKRVYRVAAPLYGYRRRFGSITQKSTLDDMHDLRAIGLEALARCDGSDMDDFWLTIFSKTFQRACHVCARVDRASFTRASETLRMIASDHHSTATGLAERVGRQAIELKPFDLHVRVDRSVHQIKGILKKVMKRKLDHHQRQRRVTASNEKEREA